RARIVPCSSASTTAAPARAASSSRRSASTRLSVTTRETSIAPTTITGSAVAITRKRRCVRREKIRAGLGMEANLTISGACPRGGAVLMKAHLERTKNATACELFEENGRLLLSGKGPSLGISIADLNRIRLGRRGRVRRASSTRQGPRGWPAPGGQGWRRIDGQDLLHERRKRSGKRRRPRARRRACGLDGSLQHRRLVLPARNPSGYQRHRLHAGDRLGG